jgi:tRNA U38,U39,U40 pseudouridine synthase TruA
MSLFALMTAAVVAKLRPNPDVETTKRIAELERQIEELEVRLDSARTEAKDWEVVSSAWRARYEQAVFPYAQAQQQQMAAALQHQAAMNAQMAMQANSLHQYQQGMLGAQNFDGFCNCVPSRSQMWHANRA